MKKSIIYSLILLSFSLLHSPASSAQELEWKNNWYLSIEGGTQVLFSSDVNNLEWKQRFTPAVSLSGGKWFSPFLGVRLQATGYSLNGYSTSEGIYLGDPLNNGSVYGVNDPVRGEVTIRPDGSYRHYLRYVNAHVDIRTSLFNLFGGIKDHRWDVIPSVGIGYFRTLEYKGTPATDNISTHFALTGKYSLTKQWDVNLELSGTALPGSFDGRITRHACEAAAALTVGVTYNFGNRPSRLTPCNYYSPSREKKSGTSGGNIDYKQILDKMSAIDTKVNTIESQISDEGRKPKEIREKEVIAEKPVKRNPFVLASIRFDLYQSEPVKDQDIVFENIVKYLQDNPDAKIRLEGYGDKQTGTAEENMQISKKRAETALRLLRDKYGVESRRIEAQALGANVQPYQDNSWNRVVVVRAM